MKVSSILNIFLLTVFIVLLPAFSFSAENKSVDSVKKSAKKPILIFNFSSSGSDENDFYSSIIPDSIAKIISSSEKFSIKKIHLTPEFKNQMEDANSSSSAKMNEKEMKQYLLNLRKSVKKNENSDQRADYLITGHFETNEENQIKIKIRIFDLEGRTADIIVVQDSANKAIFTGTIDNITSKIFEKISDFEKSRAAVSKSPFLPLYKISSIFSFGVESGYIFFLQPWTGLYNNPMYARPNFTAHIGKYFGISANVMYFNLYSSSNQSGNSLDMTVWAPSLDLHFFLNIAKYLHISISAGGGFAYSHLTMFQNSSGPSSVPVLDKSSYDMYIDSSLSVGVNLGPVTLRVGSSYKLILFTDNPLHMISVFGGFQYRI